MREARRGYARLMRMLVSWLLSTLSLLVVAHVVPGFYVRGFWAALWAALVIGLINATLGAVLKVITFPLTLLTLGLFWFVINALMIEVAAMFVRGFYVSSFGAALLGALAMALVNLVLRRLVLPRREFT